MLIKKIGARPIFDSRKNQTIEVFINSCKASSPSGKSTGTFETPCWNKSLEWNIKAINSLRINLEVSEFKDLIKIERIIKDKFKLKDAKKFGGNALFALESAILKALAKSKGLELWQIINPNARKLPTPLGNAIGGGLHSEGFANHPTFQEFLLAPKGNSFKEKLFNMQSVYSKLGKLMKTDKINDEGAWQTSLNEEEVLEVLSKFKSMANFGIDVAASSFHIDKSNSYQYQNKELSRVAQIHFINSIIDKFSPLYIEDPLHENDFNGFSLIKKKNLIAGDDLTVTHIDRIKKAVKNKSINAMIIKPNQNGSLIEVAEVFKLCKKEKITTIISHRSGETLDDALADYAFGFQADFIKCGIATKWRKIKLLRLLDLEKSLKYK